MPAAIPVVRCEVFSQVKCQLALFLWQPQDVVGCAGLGINATATCSTLVHMHPTDPSHFGQVTLG